MHNTKEYWMHIFDCYLMKYAFLASCVCTAVLYTYINIKYVNEKNWKKGVNKTLCILTKQWMNFFAQFKV